MKPMTKEHFAILRRHMVELIAIHVDLMSEELGKALLQERVLSAMLRIPRHLFVPPELAAFSYQDTPLPIGFGKTLIEQLRPGGRLVLPVGPDEGQRLPSPGSSPSCSLWRSWYPPESACSKLDWRSVGNRNSGCRNIRSP